MVLCRDSEVPAQGFEANFYVSNILCESSSKPQLGLLESNHISRAKVLCPEAGQTAPPEQQSQRRVQVVVDLQSWAYDTPIAKKKRMHIKL